MALCIDFCKFSIYKAKKQVLTSLNQYITTLMLALLPLKASDDSFGMYEPLAAQAIASLAKLSGMMRASAISDLFWLNWLMREAQISNQIEGTYTTLDEVFAENVGVKVSSTRKNDVREVINYRDAMLTGMEYLKEGRTVTSSFIKELHAQLLSGARGENKYPGAFRLIPVQIGRPAVYIPPDATAITELIENLEQFMRREDINPVVQTAIMHAQFEMIHPFCDGNGRLGRLLITLFLTQKGIIDLPCFYISAYFHEHRRKYYDLLGGISQKGDWQNWIIFFLHSVIERSRHNMQMLVDITNLYEKSKDKFPNSKYSIKVMDYIFKNPLFTLPNLKKSLDLPVQQQAMATLLEKLELKGIISKVTDKKGRKPAIWKFLELMELIENS